MRRLLVLAVCLLCAGLAQAQDVKPSIEVDLWCGVAFDLAVRDVPETAAPEVKSVTDPYRAGADMLLGRARAAYLEIGLTDDGFADLLSDTEDEVTRQLASTDPAISPQHSFEACAALIGL
jgi:hypothetical protein